MAKQPVVVKITGRQIMLGGEEQVMELTTTGAYQYKNGEHVLEYSEYDAVDEQKSNPVAMRLVYDGKQVRMFKEDGESGVTVFEEGKKFISIRNTMLGTVEMGLLPLEVYGSFSERGGELDLRYQMDMEQQMISVNELEVCYYPRGNSVPC